MVFLSAAVVLLAVRVTTLSKENRRLRAAADAPGESGPGPGANRFHVAAPAPPPSPVQSPAVPPGTPGSHGPAKIVPAAAGPTTGGTGATYIRSQPDGNFALTDANGTVVGQITPDAALEVAQSIQAALLESSSTKPGGPSWSPGQVAGPANTDGHGDFSTAWASQQPDGGPEWLQVRFERAVELSEIIIHETFNPGALSKVSALLPDGSYKTLWEGTTPAEGESVERALPVRAGITSDHIRIELDTKRVPGWNEIDAVQLVGSDGSRQWANQATASSHYGQNRSYPSLLEPGFQNTLQGLQGSQRAD